MQKIPVFPITQIRVSSVTMIGANHLLSLIFQRDLTLKNQISEVESMLQQFGRDKAFKSELFSSEVN